MKPLADTIALTHSFGFKFSLGEDYRCWWAIALGDNVQMGHNGALYTRAIAFGKTADEAMQGLCAELKKLRVTLDDDADLV